MPEKAKWGFGFAPFKLETLEKNKRALTNVRSCTLQNQYTLDSTEDISIAKGLFNRIVREDQWDWFTCNMYFDYPNRYEIKLLTTTLAQLRKCIIERDAEKIGKYRNVLVSSNFLAYLGNFLTFDGGNVDTNEEYIYILSRKEERDLLAIVLAGRNIEKRVKEINSEPSMLYPFAPRKVYRVTDGKEAEKLMHGRLDDFKLGNSSGFYRLDFFVACKYIEDMLAENSLFYYKYV